MTATGGTFDLGLLSLQNCKKQRSITKLKQFSNDFDDFLFKGK